MTNVKIKRTTSQREQPAKEKQRRKQSETNAHSRREREKYTKTGKEREETLNGIKSLVSEKK